MHSFLKHIRYMIWIMMAILCHHTAFSANSDGNMFVKCEFNKTEFYAHECVCATIWLYSVDADIAYVNELSSPSLKKGEFSYLSRLSHSPKAHRENVRGTEYFVFPLSSYMFTMSNEGKYQMINGEFEIGINIPVVYDDPFYGRVRGMETRSQIVRMSPSGFKVKPLPPIKNDMTFSGAVGEFEVKTIVPEGDIIVNEDASLIIIVKGRGFIGPDILPEYKEAFGNGNKLKSFTDRSNSFYDGKDIVSELELECEFVPNDINNCEIGVIRFGYFNPKSGKYEVAESEPVRIDVKSSAVKIAPIYI